MVPLLKIIAAVALGFFIAWLVLLDRFKPFRRRYGFFRKDEESDTNSVLNCIFVIMICGIIIYFASDAVVSQPTEAFKAWCFISASVGAILAAARYLYIDFIKDKFNMGDGQ